MNIGHIIEVFWLCLFAPVPGNVGFNRIETGFLNPLKSIAPQFFRTAEVMKRSTEDKGVFAVDRKAMAVVLNPIGMTEGGLSRGASRQGKRKNP